MNIGEKIKRARIEKGFTQEELGKLIGVQKSAVAKYEKGRIVNIKRSTLAKLSKVLGIPPVELVSDIEEKPVETANFLADIFMMDTEDKKMLEEYNSLNEQKKMQVREYVHLLSGRS
jgi:transcriptional regulator with XRE-family HTH domain